MKKYAGILVLSMLGSSHLLKPSEAAVVFQEKVQTLERLVKPSSNPFSTILNKSYRLPTQQEYHERIEVAIHVFKTTGRTRLLREIATIGYQSSWLKKHTILNTVAESAKYSPMFSANVAAAGLFTLFPELFIILSLKLSGQR